MNIGGRTDNWFENSIFKLENGMEMVFEEVDEKDKEEQPEDISKRIEKLLNDQKTEE